MLNANTIECFIQLQLFLLVFLLIFFAKIEYLTKSKSSPLNLLKNCLFRSLKDLKKASLSLQE